MDDVIRKILCFFGVHKWQAVDDVFYKCVGCDARNVNQAMLIHKLIKEKCEAKVNPETMKEGG